MTEIMKKFIVALTLLAAFAASSGAFLRVTPSMNELVVNPGQDYKGVLLVENPSDEKTLVSIDVKDWWKESTGQQTVPLSQWLTIKSAKPFVLKPGGKKKINYKISLTPGTTGEVAAMIFFQTMPVHKVEGKNIISTRNGVSLYVVAVGSANVEGVATDIQASFSGATLKSTINFSTLIKNTGDIHVRPGGTVSIFSKGKLVESAKLEWGWPIYPNQEHRFNATSEKKDWQAGRYTVVVRVDYGKPFAEDFIVQSATDITIDSDGKITAGY
jgi:P pilus assembly chaperone PapD